MRAFALALILGAACVFAVFHARVSADEPTVESVPTPLVQEAKVAKKIVKEIDPTLRPEYVSLLKKHATERTDFFDAQSKARQDLQAKQARERDELVQSHRSSRHAFEDEKHSRDERADFYHKQRSEMAELKSRHESELAELQESQRKDLSTFHLRQHQENSTLLRELSQAH